jgi:chemotaxis protein histidine kinase CheA
MSSNSKIQKSSKNDRPGDTREPRTRGEKSAIGNHDERVKKLEEERAKLEETKEQDMFTEDDEKRISSINIELKKYASAMTQVKVNSAPQPESSAAADQHATGQQATEQQATEQQATEQQATEQQAKEQQAKEQQAKEQQAKEQQAKEQHATAQNKTANAPSLGTTHANARESPSGRGDIKMEGTESKMPTKRLVDDLGMAWDVDVNDTHVELPLQNQEKAAIGHIMRTSQARYCVAYGSEARSARFESSLPYGSRYQASRDVTKRSNRIVERIVQFHRDKKEALPMDILSRVKILLVYWDSKMGVGHAAEIDVLSPHFEERRPHTRCLIHLDPKLYETYNLENNTGYSHETRSTMKPLMEGNDDWQKSITFHNIAVRLENKFEKECMVGVSGRPGPLRELVQERKVSSSRSRSRYATAEPSASRSRYATSAPSISDPPFDMPPSSPRQPTTLPKTRHEQTPTIVKSGTSLKQQFHMEFLELFDLADNVTYADLTEKQQLLYPAQFTKWKAVNS